MASDMSVGARLGSERLFAETPSYTGEQIKPLEQPLGLPPDMPRGWTDPAEQPNVAPGFAMYGEGEQGPRREVEKPRKRRPQRRKQPPHPRRERRLAARTADANWRDLGSTGLELTGIAAITAGSWLIAAWLGLVVLGLCLILLGVAMGLPRDK